MQTKYHDEIFSFLQIYGFPILPLLQDKKKEQVFEELDKDNDKIITSNEFDRDLK